MLLLQWCSVCLTGTLQCSPLGCGSLWGENTALTLRVWTRKTGLRASACLSGSRWTHAVQIQWDSNQIDFIENLRVTHLRLISSRQIESNQKHVYIQECSYRTPVCSVSPVFTQWLKINSPTFPESLQSCRDVTHPCSREHLQWLDSVESIRLNDSFRCSVCSVWSPPRVGQITHILSTYAVESIWLQDTVYKMKWQITLQQLKM